MNAKRLFLLSASLVASACADAVAPGTDEAPARDLREFPPQVLRWESAPSPPVLVLDGARLGREGLAAPDLQGKLTIVLETYQASFWVFNDRAFALELRYAAPGPDNGGEHGRGRGNGKGNGNSKGNRGGQGRGDALGNGGGNGNGDDDSDGARYTPFLRLKVPAGSLHEWPDGRRFGPRDSVEVTVRADSTQLMVRFSPGGLRFVPACPVLLEIFYGRARGDFNGDGVVNRADEKLQYRLRLWHQTQPDGSWARHVAEHVITQKSFKAPICGFSGYAISF